MGDKEAVEVAHFLTISSNIKSINLSKKDI